MSISQYSHPQSFTNITFTTITSLGCINHFVLLPFRCHRCQQLRIQSEELDVATFKELNIAILDQMNHLDLYYWFKQQQWAATATVDYAIVIAGVWLLPI